MPPCLCRKRPSFIGLPHVAPGHAIAIVLGIKERWAGSGRPICSHLRLDDSIGGASVLHKRGCTGVQVVKVYFDITLRGKEDISGQKDAKGHLTCYISECLLCR